MERNIICRDYEKQRLSELYKSNQPEFVAVYGRRRVGKTFLIREMFENKITFDLVGMAKATLIEQLTNFTVTLNQTTKTENPKVRNWLEAFAQLRNFLEKSSKKRKLVFIDEISWLDTKRSGFLSAFEHFWNSWGCMQKDLMLLVCGSATSWIINKLINNHGGLHNRLTATIHLYPFMLAETQKYLKRKKINYNIQNLSECYMITGGVPFYLSKMKKEFSLAQNIDNMFFNKESELKLEFRNLYNSLFDESEDYIKIVEVLSKKRKGLTRKEIAKMTKLSSGGTLTERLQNLEYCGFISSYSTIGKEKRDTLFQLMDNFTLFHFKYLANNDFKDEHFWSKNLTSTQHNAWAGNAFEMLMLQHTGEIKKTLEISGIQSAVYSWRSEDAEDGSQIDLVIDRKDGMINLCEIKFAQDKFTIKKSYEENLRHKIVTFQEETKTKKAINLILLTTYGLTNNKYAGVVQNTVTIDDILRL
jgi:AAA+ ATPase superfamily predicted ATPase